MQISGASQGTIAEVSNHNRLLVDTISQDRSAHFSSDHGATFSWSSTYAATGGQYVMSIKNTDTTKNLHLQKIVASNSAASIWTVSKLVSGTPAGTSITGQNMNFNSGISANTASFGNASVTGITTVEKILLFSQPANSTFAAMCDGNIIITTNQTICISPATTGTVTVTVIGWFE